jgi:hypothetical protein
MNFNRDTFAQHLSHYSGVSMTMNNNQPKWNQWAGTTGTLNTQLSYSKGGFNYRSWSPESTAMDNNLGILVSLKIDFANGIGDDHIILLVGFMNVEHVGPEMVFAQASVQFHGDDDLNIMGAPIKSDPTSPIDLGQAMYDSLNSQIQADHFGSDSTSQGRKTLPDIARANVNSLVGAVTL